MIRSNKWYNYVYTPQTTHIHCRKIQNQSSCIYNHWTSFYYRLWLPYCKQTHSFIPCVTDCVFLLLYVHTLPLHSAQPILCYWCECECSTFVYISNGVLFILICLRLMCVVIGTRTVRIAHELSFNLHNISLSIWSMWLLLWSSICFSRLFILERDEC